MITNNNIFKKYQTIRFKNLRLPISPFFILKGLHQSEYWDRSEIEKYQLEKINKLIEESRDQTIYYKEILLMINKSFNNLDEFKNSFPVLTKKEIREYYKELINYNIQTRHRHSTSGSTGTPIVVEISGMAEAYRLAGIMRFYSWWGIKSTDRSVLIWGFKQTIIKKGIINRIKRKFRNRLDINIFDLNDQTILNYFEEIEKFNPVYIRGYKSALYSLAELMERHNLQFKKAKLKIAIVTSEILQEEEREFIEKILKCKVVNEYGSGECGLYAHECPEGSMHINEESIFISTDGQNKAKVTELHNNGMPLINYMNDDGIEISDKFCSCGRTSRLIENIQGRVSDYILCPDGSKKSMHRVSHIMKELNDLGKGKCYRQFKVTQRNNNFLFEIVPDLNYKSAVSDYILKRMHQEIGNEIIVDIKLVKEIKREKSGKLRFFIRKED